MMSLCTRVGGKVLVAGQGEAAGVAPVREVRAGHSQMEKAAPYTLPGHS